MIDSDIYRHRYANAPSSCILDYLNDQHCYWESQLRLPQAPADFQSIRNRLIAIKSAQTIVKRLGIEYLMQ